MQDSSKLDTQPPSLREVKYEYTPQLPEILTHLRASILVTTYQAGKLLVLGAKDGKLQISFLDYDQPMGLAVSRERIAIGTRKQVHFLVPAHETQAFQSEYDGCFVPRNSFYTGSIHGHDLGWGQDGLWIVNTLFSSLATLHDDYSFVPQWRPPFISQLIDQDRCHLNGMAMENGLPKFVTAMSQMDTAAGWRSNKATSGIIMEVPSGQVVCSQLCMPHSPRLYADRLWVLNSGHGSLGYVNQVNGSYEPVEAMPGYTRGLSFYGQFAFVGLSKIRETSIFGGVPIAERRDELRCGIGVVDLVAGKTIAVFQFLSGVTEIFAVEVLAGFCNPLIAGASVDMKEREVWVVPAEGTPRPKVESRFPIYSTKRYSGTSQPSHSNTMDSNVSELMTIGQQLQANGQSPESVNDLERAIAESKQPAPLLVDLGNIRQDQGKQLAAKLCYERALESDSTCFAALQNLGYLLFNLGETEKSGDIYAQLLDAAPTPLNRLLAASVLPVVYDSEADIEHWRKRQLEVLRDLAKSGQQVDATTSLVPTCFFAAYQGRCDRQVMEMRAAAIRGGNFLNPRKPKQNGERLRVGFLSAFFRDHTIGRLNVGRLEQLSRDAIELTVIYAGSSLDEMTTRFKSTADKFVHLPRRLSDALETLKSLELDILVHADVGMDSLTQTLAFSRFAPIQVATWGHPDTTGSVVMDYFLSSEQLENADAQTHYSERLVKLPSLGIVYERPVLTKAKTRAELGLSSDRHLYACPQTLFKFHPAFDEILAGILLQDPQAELVLLEGRLPEWTHRLQRRFRRTLPDAETRVKFLPNLVRNDFLSLLSCSDVLLDPIHFGGGNSSFEAIGLGIPLVTLEGEFLRSRISSAIYRQMNLPDLIASDPNAYVQLAVKIACDPMFRSELKQRIIAASDTLFESSSAAKELEECLVALGQGQR